jgi:hypothetical protein
MKFDFIEEKQMQVIMKLHNTSLAQLIPIAFSQSWIYTNDTIYIIASNNLLAL